MWSMSAYNFVYSITCDGHKYISLHNLRIRKKFITNWIYDWQLCRLNSFGIFAKTFTYQNYITLKLWRRERKPPILRIGGIT